MMNNKKPARPGSPGRVLIFSFKNALTGIWHALRTQQNMRIHLTATMAVIVLGLYLELSTIQWAVLALTIGTVLAAEMFNTVAEAAMDAAIPEYHPLVRIAKDVAAGAVLIAAIIAVIVGLLILGPPLWQRILP